MTLPHYEAVERQRLLPRITVRALIGLTTLAAAVAWAARAASAGRAWAIVLCTLLAMLVFCLLAYAVVFLISWIPARLVLGEEAGGARQDGVLPPQLVTPPRDVAQ